MNSHILLKINDSIQMVTVQLIIELVQKFCETPKDQHTSSKRDLHEGLVLGRSQFRIEEYALPKIRNVLQFLKVMKQNMGI